MDKREIDPTKMSLQITGMTCAACANRVERGLNQLPGVVQATVNLALETAQVEYDPKQVDIADIQDRVSRLGYGATVKAEGETGDESREQEIPTANASLFDLRRANVPAAVVDGQSFQFYGLDLDARLFDESARAVCAGSSGSILGRRSILRRRL